VWRFFLYRGDHIGFCSSEGNEIDRQKRQGPLPLPVPVQVAHTPAIDELTWLLRNSPLASGATQMAFWNKSKHEEWKRKYGQIMDALS
jgi:hypothetical protein